MNDNNLKWRFPQALHAKKRGYSSAEFETFRRDPFKSLAREILQNSIDAKNSDEEPVRVEFKLFKMKKNNIPGIDDFKAEIQNCYDTWYENTQNEMFKTWLNNMIAELEKEEITCLRISDFNTTGLRGVNSNNEKNNQFLALTKGIGISEKNTTGMSGGSKGVGKYAAYGTSLFSLLFYSTKTVLNETGSIGVAELVSSDCKDGSGDWTQGVGYFGIDEKHTPSSNLLNLDPNFVRNENGTDIYIIGFKETIDWEKDVINKLLDSFLVSIYYKKLEIYINNIEITSTNLLDIINSDYIQDKELKNFMSQYRLISNTNNDVCIKTIDTDYGSLELYVLPLSKEEEDLATHKCDMIRIPYMKIKHFKLSQNIRVSALCIITDTQLGRYLLSIENPQHTDWEYKRIEDNSLRKEIILTMKFVEDQIQTFVMECIKSGNTNEVDPYGAGDFIPSVEESGENKNDNEIDLGDVCLVKPSKENKTTVTNPIMPDEDSLSIEPDIGLEGEDGDDLEHPEGEGLHKGDDPHSGSGTSTKSAGDNIVFERKELTGVKYRVIVLDKNVGKYRIIFDYIANCSSCILRLSYLDDVGGKIKATVKELSCNGETIFTGQNFEKEDFSIIKGKNKIDLITGKSGIYSFEVKIYANR